jgi:transposase
VLLVLRRLVGIDLGVASAHTVRVLDEVGREVCRRRCVPTVESLTAIESAALVGAPAGTRLEVVLEPTGPAWLPVAVFFVDRGHVVFRVSSQKAADLRRFLNRHAKSNGIDADTLARLPLVHPDGLVPLTLPTAEQAALDRRVRACDRLTRQAAVHKVRIKDLVRQLMPAAALPDELGRADLAVLERWADPRALLRAGRVRISAVIAKASNGQLGAARAEQWLTAARQAVELYGDHPAVAFADLASEVATEVRLLRAIQGELAEHAGERENAYRWADPGQLARTLPGLAEVGGPVLAAVIADAARFPDGAHFKAYLGLTPRASETGETDRKGQPMSKAGSRLARTTLIRAADHARRQDPQLARIYYIQMVERGATHLKALCVVAARLAERVWTVRRRGMPYVICDTDATPVTAQQAKQIIAEQWTVPEHVRTRRRSRKTKAGKAPQQVRTGQDKSHAHGVDKRGDLPRNDPHPSRRRPSNPRP